MNEASLSFLFTILAILILLSAFFSSSETGMMSLNRYRLKHLKGSGHRGALRASRLLRRPDRLIGLILIGNNLVNILASAIATVIAIRIWGADTGIAIATVSLTLVILIFAEITPKTIAALHPEAVAFPASVILLPLMTVMYPVVWLINGVTNGLLKLVGINPAEHPELAITSDELRSIVNNAGHHISAQHQGMLLNILELEKVTVDDIMIPRSDVFGLDIEEDDETLLRKIQSSEYTRLPIYKENINDIIGMLHLRRSSRVIDENGLHRERMLAELEEPYFIPEGTPLTIQLMNFQTHKHRIAVVVDEYGEVMGLVALEDILEEIVGEFTSNLAEVDDDIAPDKGGAFIINGTTAIRDINKSLGWTLPISGPKTLNGLLLEQLEGFPDGNVGVTVGNYHLEILELQDNVIRSVRASQHTNSLLQLQ